VKKLEFEKMILLAAAGIALNITIPAAGFKIIKRWDRDKPPILTDRAVVNIIAAAVPVQLCGLTLFAGNSAQMGLWKEKYILLEVFSGCMIFACTTDVMIHKVYDFTWWAAAPAVIGMYCIEYAAVADMTGLIIFIILQEKFFCALYGRADCHAFCICAAVGISFGLGVMDFFIHMILAFLMLSAIQHFKKNAASGGKLKKPVAFIPYITAAFWINMMCGLI
jgi:type IV secretory pathway protease TraF